MPRLNPVPSGKVALKASWFKSVRDRIEEIKPLQGEYIIIQQTSDGNTISVDIAKVAKELEGNGGGLVDVAEYTLNVCSGGQPATLVVYGPIVQA